MGIEVLDYEKGFYEELGQSWASLARICTNKLGRNIIPYLQYNMCNFGDPKVRFEQVSHGLQKKKDPYE